VSLADDIIEGIDKYAGIVEGGIEVALKLIGGDVAKIGHEALATAQGVLHAVKAFTSKAMPGEEAQKLIAAARAKLREDLADGDKAADAAAEKLPRGKK
jgi:hypothetical protein